jgi:hypothetical protein
MVGADERLIVNGPEREARTAMHAEVTPRMYPLADPPQHDIFVQEANRHWFAFPEVGRVGDYMPVVAEHCI